MGKVRLCRLCISAPLTDQVVNGLGRRHIGWGLGRNLFLFPGIHPLPATLCRVIDRGMSSPPFLDTERIGTHICSVSTKIEGYGEWFAGSRNSRTKRYLTLGSGEAMLPDACFSCQNVPPCLYIPMHNRRTHNLLPVHHVFF